VESHLGQNVGERDADEHARRQRERAADDEIVTRRVSHHAEVEEPRADRASQSERGVDELPRAARPPLGTNHRRDDERVERLVERDRGEGSEAEERCRPPSAPLGEHAGPERDAIEKGVEGEPEGEADPALAAGGNVARMAVKVVRMGVVGLVEVRMRPIGIDRRLDRRGVEMEDTEKAERENEAEEAPACNGVDRPDMARGVGKEMENGHAQHEPADEAQENLPPRVGEAQRRGDAATGQRRGDDERAVEDERQRRFHRRFHVRFVFRAAGAPLGRCLPGRVP